VGVKAARVEIAVVTDAFAVAFTQAVEVRRVTEVLGTLAVEVHTIGIDATRTGGIVD